MDTTLIYAKTPKGVFEIRKRSGRLSPLMRRILIMINGRSEFSHLAPAVPPGQLAGILTELETQGLIEVSDVIPTALPPAEDEGFDLDLELPEAPPTAQRLEPRFNLAPPRTLGPLTLRPGGEPAGAPAPIAPRPAPAAAAPAPVAAAPVRAPAVARPASAPVVTLQLPNQAFDERKGRAVRELFNLLGPYGETAGAAIRDAATVTDLLNSIRDAGSRIAVFRGQAVARDYLRTHGVDAEAVLVQRHS